MAHFPAVLEAYVSLRRTTARLGTLDQAMRAALMLASAAAAGNRYAVAVLSALALRSGWRQDQVDALRDGQDLGDEAADALIGLVHEAEHRRIDALGVDWVLRPATQPWGSRSMVFKDPEGHLVNVFSRP
jgi:catechol 2,3-dioxygenase-like lactoylglutathione lyase family enzyme